MMIRVTRTHILFDFFGTLVNYSASRTEQGYPLSYELVRRCGVQLTYQEFLDAWSRISADFDASSDVDDHEFSMTQVATAFLGGLLGAPPATDDVDEFVARFVTEWSKGVHYLPGLEVLLAGLAGSCRLAVVTNTHHAPLVPDHLRAMGVSGFFNAVVTSVEVGWRKPHPRIYTTVLDALGIEPSAAVFVGDTFGPDFAGPQSMGIRAYLIDPDRRAPVPPEQRLASVFDLPAALGHPA